jgi:cytochrome b
LGGWMIMLMLITLCALVLTGLLAEGKTGGAGALSTILSPAQAKLVGNLHAWLGFAIIWLAAVHVAGVVTESLLQRENLIVAMITGRKLAPDITITDEHQVSAWRAVPVALVLVILGAWLAWRTHLAPP